MSSGVLLTSKKEPLNCSARVSGAVNVSRSFSFKNKIWTTRGFKFHDFLFLHVFFGVTARSRRRSAFKQVDNFSVSTKPHRCWYATELLGQQHEGETTDASTRFRHTYVPCVGRPMMSLFIVYGTCSLRDEPPSSPFL